MNVARATPHSWSSFARCSPLRKPPPPGSGVNPVSHRVWKFTPVSNQSNVPLVFNDSNAPNTVHGILLDNIVLQTIPGTTGAAPEPASFLMLGAGLAALFAARRR